MKATIDLIGIITSQFDEMLSFYRDVLGFAVKRELESYVEFEHTGVRFAIFTHKIMAETTGHENFREDKKV